MFMLGFCAPLGVGHATSTWTAQRGTSFSTLAARRHLSSAPVFVVHSDDTRRTSGQRRNGRGARAPIVAVRDEAIESGQAMRDELDRLTNERKELAAQTEENLRVMNEQLAALMAQVREEFGMPAVSDLSEDDADSSTSTASPSASNSTTVSSSSTSSETAAETAEESASSSSSSSSSEADEPYMDPKDFGYESTAGWQVLAESLQLPNLDDDGKIEMKIQCDTNGCTYIERRATDDESSGAAEVLEKNFSGVRSKFIVSGSGYRVGFDPDASKSCCALLGGGGDSSATAWTVSLSFEEMRHFKRLVQSLQKRMDHIGSREEDMPAKDSAVLRRSADGLFNIRISRAALDCSVEHESKLVWTQAIGQPVLGQYCIRAIFTEGRKAELFWPPDVIPNLLPALNKVRIE